MSTSYKYVQRESLLRRFWQYQKERFPLLGHGLLITAFTFSAISYSSICRGIEGFIPWPLFAVAIFTTLGLFFLLRVFDEHKDALDDSLYRSDLPVPRGLISLRELAWVGGISVIAQIAVNALFVSQMLVLYAIVLTYMLLMAKEFFIAEWLKKRQLAYVFSHMLIIPLVDIYASGFDWLLAEASAPAGLGWFFAVSFMNGIVLEFGRKIRIPSAEREGVVTYSSLYGFEHATKAWIGIMAFTLGLSITAAFYAGFGWLSAIVLTIIFLLCSSVGISFLQQPTEKKSSWIEHASGIWTIAMYLTLGGVPKFIQLLF